MKPRNDRALALSAFCLEIEKHRRTPEGRVRNAGEFLSAFFPHEGGGSAKADRIFVHLPREVRGPILAGWRIRGAKAAVRDDDERVQAVVADALEAGDLDATTFEEGLTPETVIDYVPLDEWWQFWRGASLPNAAVQKALATARAMRLIDDRWFLENVEGRGGRLKGTDAVADTLTKDDIIRWIRSVHESGDATPSGLIAARGWDSVLAKTAPEALLVTLDAFARKVHLLPPEPAAPRPISSPPKEDLAGPSPVALSKVAADSSPVLGSWGDEVPESGPGEVVSESELHTLKTPHRPPPMTK